MCACTVLGRHEATDLSKCIPLIVHADDAESHRRRSFTVCSMASLLVEGGSPWETRLLLYCLDVARSTAETTDGLDAYLVWSFTELMTGRYLEHGPWSDEMPRRAKLGGKLIADGWRAIVCVHRGDEKYLQKCYHMRISWVSEEVCWRCRASRLPDSSELYTFFGPNASHRSTLCDTAGFIERTCRANPWVRLPGFHASMVWYDFLHVFDLTIQPDAAASAT